MSILLLASCAALTAGRAYLAYNEPHAGNVFSLVGLGTLTAIIAIGLLEVPAHV